MDLEGFTEEQKQNWKDMREEERGEEGFFVLIVLFCDCVFKYVEMKNTCVLFCLLLSASY